MKDSDLLGEVLRIVGWSAVYVLVYMPIYLLGAAAASAWSFLVDGWYAAEMFWTFDGNDD